jgi:hypothetical protein
MMGRGLSDLQRFILKKSSSQKRLHHCEILEGYFGWKPRNGTIPRWGVGAHAVLDCKPEEKGEVICPGSQRYNPREIGIARYRKTRAALSRSCRRLESRGLVECVNGMYCHWAGVKITEKGRHWLSVNSEPN